MKSVFGVWFEEPLEPGVCMTEHERTSSTLRMKYQYCLPAGTNLVTQRTCSCKECNVDRISAKSGFRVENVVVVVV